MKPDYDPLGILPAQTEASEPKVDTSKARENLRNLGRVASSGVSVDMTPEEEEAILEDHQTDLYRSQVAMARYLALRRDRLLDVVDRLEQRLVDTQENLSALEIMRLRTDLSKEIQEVTQYIDRVVGGPAPSLIDNRQVHITVGDGTKDDRASREAMLDLLQTVDGELAKLLLPDGSDT